MRVKGSCTMRADDRLILIFLGIIEPPFWYTGTCQEISKNNVYTYYIPMLQEQILTEYNKQGTYMSRDITKPKNKCAHSEDSDQPGHLLSLIRVFAVRMRKAWVLSYPLSTQRRLWSDWADAQLIWVFARCTATLLVLSCPSSYDHAIYSMFTEMLFQAWFFTPLSDTNLPRH